MIFRIRYKNLDRFLFRFVIEHAFDRETDRQNFHR